MVLTEITTTWERALARAEAKNLTAQRAGDIADGPVVTQWYRVGSWSRNGLEHGVRVQVSAAGIDVQCSCEGGLNERPCQHAAAVLKLAGWLGEQPKPAPTITAGEIKRLKGKRSIALLNGDEDELDRLDAQLAAYGAA